MPASCGWLRAQLTSARRLAADKCSAYIGFYGILCIKSGSDSNIYFLACVVAAYFFGVRADKGLMFSAFLLLPQTSY